ncbi:DUF2306 domain-containing protein [Mesorhizobium sp. ORM6]
MCGWAPRYGLPLGRRVGHNRGPPENTDVAQPLFNAPPVIQIHALVAIVALLLGAMQLWRTKGDPLHRALGRVWVALMATVAGSGLFIWTIRLWGPFSPIHLLSLFVLAMLWRGVRARAAATLPATAASCRAPIFSALLSPGF